MPRVGLNIGTSRPFWWAAVPSGCVGIFPSSHAKGEGQPLSGIAVESTVPVESEIPSQTNAPEYLHLAFDAESLWVFDAESLWLGVSLVRRFGKRRCVDALG